MTWGQPIQITAPSSSGLFSGVSCSDSTDCTAVGDDGNYQPIYAIESGGVWGATQFIDTNNELGTYTDFNAVSCSDPTNCTAVGRIGGGGAQGSAAIAYTEAGGAWSFSASMGGGNEGDFDGVSCSDATDCTGVGLTGSLGEYWLPSAATETDATWGPVTHLTGTSDASESLTSVSCTGPADCTAVGTGVNGSPYYVTETDGAWGTPTEVSGFPSGAGGFSAVSCPEPGDCTAVGSSGIY